MSDLKIGDAVRVKRGLAARYRAHAFTVRSVRGAEVRVDNGDPTDDGAENGASAYAWLRAGDVEPWGERPRYTTAAGLAHKLGTARQEARAILAEWDAIAPGPPCGSLDQRIHAILERVAAGGEG